MIKRFYFAPFTEEDGGAASGSGSTAPSATAGEEKPTLEELLKDEALKAEYEGALADAKKAWEKEAKEAAEKAETDPAKLAQKEVAELKAQLAAKELKEAVAGMAAEKKVPAAFVDYLIGADEKESAARVEAFSKQYSADVAAAAKAMLPGGTPKGGSGGSEDAFLEGFNAK